MESIKINVSNNIAQVTEKPLRIVAGTIGLPVEFTFDSTWDSLIKTAVFTAGNKTFSVDDIDSTATVPWEVLQRPGLRLMIGVYGENEDGTEAIPTVWANVGVIRGGATLSPCPSNPSTAPIWQKLKKVVEAGCISETRINGAGELEITYINGETVNVGNVVGADGVGIESINVETSSVSGGKNIITIETTDGHAYEFSIRNGSAGVDGKSIIYCDFAAAGQTVTDDSHFSQNPKFGDLVICTDGSVCEVTTVMGGLCVLGDALFNITGDKGNAGYTPVKGKDYFTQADKDEVIGAAVDAVPMEWLDYIESNGTQYIDTGFIPNSNTKVVMDAQFIDEGTRGALFGARTSATEKAYMMARVSSGNKVYRTIRAYYFDYTDENGTNVEWSMDGLERSTYMMDKNVASINGEEITADAVIFSCKYPMFLMALNAKGSAAWNSSMRIYSCQIYDNETLIRDLVPVRTVTGEIGLFDRVHNKLYASATDSPLVASMDSQFVGKESVQKMIDDAKADIVALVLAALNTPMLISFTIGETEYQAEEGMTWGEWCESEYNTSTDTYRWRVDTDFENRITNEESQEVGYEDSSNVYSDDVIQEMGYMLLEP